MKQSLFYHSLIAGMIIISPVLDAARASVPLTPISGKSVTISVEGKERIYYLSTRSLPVRLRVKGPVVMDVVTRFAIPAGNTSNMLYTINVVEKDSVLKRYSTSSEPSEATFSEIQSSYPAKSRKFKVRVAEGEHTIEFRPECNTMPAAVALRFLLVRRSGKQPEETEKMARIEPLSYDRVATAVVAEKLITYYVTSRQKQVHLRIIGPTTVSIDARCNFDPQMVGTQKYNLDVTEGVQSILRKSFEATKSVGTYYQDWKDVVPGKINKCSFDVPNGEHIYKFSISEGLAESVSLKFSIPEKDLQNTD